MIKPKRIYLINQTNKQTTQQIIPSFSLIEFYLWEKNYEKAVTIAQKYKSDREHLIKLADKIMVKQTQIALDFYQRVIISIVSVADKRNYQHAVSLLKQLKKSIDKLSDTRWQLEFKRLLSLIRAKERRKPSLMKRLDQHFGPA